MKPRLLKISGLNSFLEEQAIDFSKLTEKGLFGIFGPTGSGKSTILDAMTMALYGYIPRGTKEFINTYTDKMYVSYEFEIMTDRGTKIYRVERCMKKNDSGGVNTDFARLCILDNDGNVAEVFDGVSEIRERIINIIGLNQSDFTRSVVLPQGKFSEFLQLSGGERNKMLERILALEKYGEKLVGKIKGSRREIESRLEALREKLSAYQDVSQENLKLLEGELVKIEEEKERLNREIAHIDKEYERLGRVWELQRELKGYMERAKELDESAEEIETKKRKLEKGRGALKVKPYMDTLNETLGKIKTNEGLLKDIVKSIEELKNKMEATEKMYQKALDKKNRELPLLIEKKERVKNAIELSKNIRSLEKEKRELEAEYKKYRQDANEYEGLLKKANEKRNYLNRKINDAEKRIEDLKISPEYRNRLNEAWKWEKELKDLKRTRDEYEKEKEKLNESICSNRNLLKDLGDKLDKSKNNLTELENELRELERNKPKDNTYIYNRQKEAGLLTSKLKEAVENQDKKESLEKELKDILKNLEDIGSKLRNCKGELSAREEELERVKKEIKELERIHRASILSRELREGQPCPVCGSTSHPGKAREIDGSILDEKTEMSEKLEIKIKNLGGQLNKLEVEYGHLQRERDKRQKEVEVLEEKLYGINIEGLKKEVKAMEEEINNNIEGLKKWEESSKKIREMIDSKKENKRKLETERTLCQREIDRDIKRLEELKEKLKRNDEELNRVWSEYDKSKKELETENIEEKLKEIEKKDKEYEKLQKNLQKLRRDIKGLEDEREKITFKLNEAKVQMGKIEESGKEKQTLIGKYREKISSITGDENPEECLEKILELTNKIVSEEKRLNRELEEQKKNLGRLQEEKSGKENIIETLKEAAQKSEEDLQKSVKENAFHDVEEVILYLNLIRDENLKTMEEEITRYEDEVKKVKNNIERINKEIKGQSVSQEEWIKLKDEREVKRNTYDKLLEDLGNKRAKISQMKKNLNVVKELKEEVKVLEHKQDMLNEMLSLVKGNKFVEFVARSHLKYIVREASKRLMEITNKRYSLELDSGSNFIICDNYNGGARRNCNTLSGGETFVTSLSLALALSTQIQLRGNTSIEFFFLDEGFGTLDNNFLDTVMTSLEKLQSEKLSVGIISHVEELKNRIPAKLIVKPPEAGLHGTKITIETG